MKYRPAIWYNATSDTRVKSSLLGPNAHIASSGEAPAEALAGSFCAHCGAALKRALSGEMRMETCLEKLYDEA